VLWGLVKTGASFAPRRFHLFSLLFSMSVLIQACGARTAASIAMKSACPMYQRTAPSSVLCLK
jgi:hypothetical protein